jgi:carbon-monoxide dehydrogenase iron sulfur subunit
LQDSERGGPRAEFPCEYMCGVCAAVCAPGAVCYTGGTVVVDLDLCTGCGQCIRVCPWGVLKESDLARF